MARINLLDWRQARREQRQKQFFTGLGGAFGIACAIVFLILLQVNGHIEFQRERNALLKREIAQIEKQIKEIETLEKLKSDLLSRMQVIETLQQSRSEMVHFFDDLVSTIPDGVYLTSIDRKGNKTKIDGIAESNGRISTYIRNLDSSPWFHDPRLVVIKTDPKSRQRQSTFSLEVNAGAGKKRANDDEEVFE